MLPSLYDAALAPLENAGLRRWRQRLVSAASGHVLEIGGGTGLNLPHYTSITRLVFTEPDFAMLGRARKRAASLSFPIDFIAGDAQRLPFSSAAFDSVVATLAFCTIPNPKLAFMEVHRVLRPGGAFLLLEHVRTPRRWVARLQDFATPVWKLLAHGCHLNRPSLETARAAGFEVIESETALDGWVVSARLRKNGEPGAGVSG
jgi:ubiquinone/menaquinone biosynthesis C-methylase UbiE